MRMVRTVSDEARSSPGAVEAVESELASLQRLGCFDLGRPLDADEVARCVEDPHFARGFLILGEKNIEGPLEGRRWKGRLVLQGNDIRGADGARVYPEAQHRAPTSLVGIRLVEGYMLSRVDGEMYQGDVSNAFPKADLPGSPVYLDLEAPLRPSWWAKLGYRRTVVRVRKALYGHPLAGYAFSLLFHEWLLENGWQLVEDSGEQSLYFKVALFEGTWAVVLLSLYTDDVGLGGPRNHAWVEFYSIHVRWGFSEKSMSDPHARNLLGLTILRHPRQGSVRIMFVHQMGFIVAIAEQWAAALGHAKGAAALRYFDTPLKERPDVGDAAKMERAGQWGPEAAKHVGRILWPVRGTRMDGVHALLRLQRRVASWTALEDESLARLYSYLYAHRELGVWMLVDTSRVQDLRLLTWSDADHANDPQATTRSTSASFVSWGTDLRCKVPLTWAGATQGATAKSTPEAEVTSISDTVFGHAMPIQESLSQCLGRTFPMVVGTDNDAARGMVRSGHSRRLAYVRRHMRVSVGALNEALGPDNQDGNVLVREASTTMPVDVFTKPLPAREHWECLRRLGMGRYRDGPPLPSDSDVSRAVVPVELGASPASSSP